MFAELIWKIVSLFVYANKKSLLKHISARKFGFYTLTSFVFFDDYGPNDESLACHKSGEFGHWFPELQE